IPCLPPSMARECTSCDDTTTQWRSGRDYVTQTDWAGVQRRPFVFDCSDASRNERHACTRAEMACGEGRARSRRSEPLIGRHDTRREVDGPLSGVAQVPRLAVKGERQPEVRREAQVVGVPYVAGVDVRRGLAADDRDHVGGLRAPGRGAVAKGSEGVVPRPIDRAGGAQIGGLVWSPASLGRADTVVGAVDLPERVGFAGIRGPDLRGALDRQIVARQLVDLRVAKVARRVPTRPPRGYEIRSPVRLLPQGAGSRTVAAGLEVAHVGVVAIHGGAGEDDGLGVTIAAAAPGAGFHVPVRPHHVEMRGSVVDDLGPFDDQARVVEHGGRAGGDDLVAMLPVDEILGGVAADRVEVAGAIRVQGLVFAEPVPGTADLDEPAPGGLDLRPEPLLEAMLPLELPPLLELPLLVPSPPTHAPLPGDWLQANTSEVMSPAKDGTFRDLFTLYMFNALHGLAGRSWRERGFRSRSGFRNELPSPDRTPAPALLSHRQSGCDATFDGNGSVAPLCPRGEGAAWVGGGAPSWTQVAGPAVSRRRRRGYAVALLAPSLAGAALPGIAAAQPAKTFIDYFQPTPITCPLTSKAWGCT